MNLSDSPSCGIIEQWEEAGASLVAAFKDYTDICLGLGNSSLRGDAQWSDLVPRIDSTFGVVHARISRYLGESSRALARTRNKFASPLFKLPQDVLLEIFLNVVFDRDDSEQFGRPSIEQDTWLIYHRLYDLIAVCSTWRDMIMTNGTFWSVIPMVSSLSTEGERQFELCLQRAGESTLHLAANLGSSMSSRDLAVVLAEHGSRFRTINITMGDTNAIRDVIGKLLKQAQHGSLSQLFIQASGSRIRMHRVPTESDYIVSHDPPLSNLMQSLTAFRICRVHFRWDTISFSSRLSELRIEQVSLGYDDTIAPFVQALASATNLRDLKIISLLTFRRSGETSDSTPSEPVAFPALESLTIKNLYLNTLEGLLPMISPGSHCLTLFLSRNSLGVNSREDLYLSDSDDESSDTIDYDSLRRVLEQTLVDTLMMTGGRGRAGEWLTRFEFTGLLKSMPTLKTLKLNQWKFGGDLCKSLTRTGRSHLPELQNLHLSSVEIGDNELFRGMIASHPLRQVVLGGFSQGVQSQKRMRATVAPDPFHIVYGGSSPGSRIHRSIRVTADPEGLEIKEDSEIVQWLRENIPELDLRLTERDYCPPEFRKDEWRLW
ncbi:unnamed protein product [Rhizoctonia solani]|uniref:F-box domain-containing protein n=1 Tax=Rhizoctonia solani TaxID=456999 RepID=A0A8H3C6Y5_9AGAM|nr:unnamed protein product [Rhizoctonia solani]CAE6523824.1 unnamed protein product [Rhizoctonia solani]